MTAMFTDIFHNRELKITKVEASVIQEYMYTHIRLINMTAKSEFWMIYTNLFFKDEDFSVLDI
jgi:hypothetical protein